MWRCSECPFCPCRWELTRSGSSPARAVPKATEPGPDGVRVAEKTFAIENGAAIDVKISVDHDMVEVFVGEQVAFTYRIFRKPEYELGLLAQDA